jgi:tetratricopeptide (TPR) repeat protein
MVHSTIKSGTLVAVLLVHGILSVAASAIARAEPRPSADSASVQRARRHFLAGKQAFEAQSYAAALREFEAGYAIEPRPGFLLNMGHAARRLGDLPRAHELYQAFLATDPPADERGVAEKLVAELERDVPALRRPASPLAATPPRLALAPSSSAAASSSAVVGAAAAPPTFSLVDAPRPSSGSSGPIYGRWWFWAGAGAVAAGVVTAILIGPLRAGSSMRDSGSLGQIKL